MKVRTDRDMANTIENGLVVDEAMGSHAAWEYLVAHGVPHHIVLRVLASSTRRRKVGVKG
jgi:hypothetical protein